LACRFYLVTGNIHKLEEASKIVSRFGVELAPAGIGKLEIQSENLEDIALAAARHAYMRLKRPVLVDDSGLFVEALGGFPGPYSSYVYRKLGVGGILKLLEGARDRRACFKTALAMIYPPLEKVFTGNVCGTIADNPRGMGGFGFDPIFVPDGYTLTFAEMSLEEKNRISHRAHAFRRFAEYASARLGCGKR